MQFRAAAGVVMTKAAAAVRAHTFDAAGIAGFGLVAYGAHEIYHPAGWLVLGFGLVAAAGLTGVAKARADHIADVGKKVAA